MHQLHKGTICSIFTVVSGIEAIVTVAPAWLGEVGEVGDGRDGENEGWWESSEQNI